MASSVKSISASQLAGEVRDSVQKLSLKGVPANPAIVARPPWIMGFIYHPPVATLDAAQDAANKVAAAMPSAKGATPAVLIQGGHIIIGFVQEAVAVPE